jgi:hypothetical protein
MKKIIKLTETDLTRIVKRIIQEDENDSPLSQDYLSWLEYNTKVDDKPFNDLLIKNNFEYLTNHNDKDIYLLKKNNYDVMVVVEHSYMDRFFLLIYVNTKGGEKINYLEDLYGKTGLTVFDNEKIKVTRLVKGAIEFGNSKKMIKENHGDRFTTVTHYIEMIEDVLDNYDSIDCENINKKYERFYCENISEYSKEKIETVLEKFKEELAGLMYNEFKGSGLFGG